MTATRPQMRQLSRATFSDLLDALTFDRLATALFFVLVTTIACLMPIQSDTWWQLRAGQDFWETGHVVLVDTYSYTAAGQFLDEPRVAERGDILRGLSGRQPAACGRSGRDAGRRNIAVTWSLMSGSTIVRLLLWAVALSAVSTAWTPRPHVFTLFLVGVSAQAHGDGSTPMASNGLSGVGQPPRRLYARRGATGRLLVGRSHVRYWHRPVSKRARRAGSGRHCPDTFGFRFWEELTASLARLQAYEV